VRGEGNYPQTRGYARGSALAGGKYLGIGSAGQILPGLERAAAQGWLWRQRLAAGYTPKTDARARRRKRVITQTAEHGHPLGIPWSSGS
jgi:hypothetical protein